MYLIEAVNSIADNIPKLLDDIFYLKTQINLFVPENCRRCNRVSRLSEDGYCCRSCELGFLNYEMENI